MICFNGHECTWGTVNCPVCGAGTYSEEGYKELTPSFRERMEKEMWCLLRDKTREFNHAICINLQNFKGNGIERNWYWIDGQKDLRLTKEEMNEQRLRETVTKSR